MPRPLQFVVLFVAVALLSVSCRSTADFIIAESDSPTEHLNSRTAANEPPTAVNDNPFADSLTGGGVDFRLERDDIDCSETNLNTYPDTPFLVAHVVVDGNLGAPCFGEPDNRLVRAWQILAMITPAGQLRDLGLFGGFVSNEQNETTLAFVNPLPDNPSQYQMSVNLDEAEIDPDELMMTMAHEFAHVFTSNPSQIDRSIFPKDCETWHNLRGCYRTDSLMWEWVETFWADGLIDQVKRKQEPSRELGAERCMFNASFLGPYSASHPEEDFAEAFSAFVFRLDVDSHELQAKMEWFALQPGLLEFRNRAVEAELGPLRNFFETCG